MLKLYVFTVFSCLPILVSIAYKFWNGRRRRTKSIRPQEQARSSKIDVLVNFIILDLQNWSAFLLRKIVFEFIFSECTKSQLMYHELSSKVMEIAHERMETIAKTFFSNCQSDKGQKIFKKGIFLPFNSSKKKQMEKNCPLSCPCPFFLRIEVKKLSFWDFLTFVQLGVNFTKRNLSNALLRLVSLILGYPNILK